MIFLSTAHTGSDRASENRTLLIRTHCDPQLWVHTCAHTRENQRCASRPGEFDEDSLSPSTKEGGTCTEVCPKFHEDRGSGLRISEADPWLWPVW